MGVIDRLYQVIQEHASDSPILLSDSSLNTSTIRSRLISTPSSILVDETLPRSKFSFSAYFPWILLTLLGIASILITFLIVKDLPTSVQIPIQPNFDLSEHYEQPAIVSEPEEVVILNPELPRIREEEDAFVIEDNSIIDDMRDNEAKSDIFLDSDVVFKENSTEFSENTSSDSTIIDDSIVDLTIPSSNTTITSSLLLILLLFSNICSFYSFLVALALWVRFQPTSFPQPVPSTPFRPRQSSYYPTTADLPPITPCPDSLEMNRRGRYQFDSNVL